MQINSLFLTRDESITWLLCSCTGTEYMVNSVSMRVLNCIERKDLSSQLYTVILEHPENPSGPRTVPCGTPKPKATDRRGGLLYLTTAVGSLFLAGLMTGGCAVWSLTPRSLTLYRACGERERQQRDRQQRDRQTAERQTAETEETKAGKETRCQALVFARYKQGNCTGTCQPPTQPRSASPSPPSLPPPSFLSRPAHACAGEEG